MLNDYQDIAKKALSGDKPAYRELLCACETLCKKYLYNRVKDIDSIDDIVQEILLSVHKALHTYMPSRPFKPWLYAIINFRFKDYLRKIYGSKEVSTVDTDDVEHLLLEDSCEQEIENKDFLQKYLSHLPEKQRIIIECLYIKELSAKEVAAKLDISVSDVRISAHRALKTMREKT